MTDSLRGKVALVTGGGRGIGTACVRRLAADGADVAIGYVRSTEKANAVAEQVRALGVRAAVFQADLADRAQAEGLAMRSPVNSNGSTCSSTMRQCSSRGPRGRFRWPKWNGCGRSTCTGWWR